MARIAKAKVLPQTKINRDEEARKVIAVAQMIREKYAHKATRENVQRALDKMAPEQKEAAMRQLAKLKRLKQMEINAKCRMDFLSYARDVMPGFIPGKHLNILASIFHRIIEGESLRVIINIAPRFGKSNLSSFLFPSWFIGRKPNRKIIQISNISRLADMFGTQVRNMVSSDRYREIFPDVALSLDTKAKDEWNTNYGGMYYAAGMTSTIIGRGADLLLIDDPHSERETEDGRKEPPSREDFDKAMDKYMNLRSRLEPGASIVVIMQRWSLWDLTGRLLEMASRDKDSDQWEVITIPAMEEDTDSKGNPIFNEDGSVAMRSNWPERWSLEALNTLKATTLAEPNGAWRWMAFYQQKPTSEELSLIKREYWKEWPKENPPNCECVIQSWDLATSSKTRANFSAMTLWGVFKRSSGDGETSANHIILLYAARFKLDFPEMKRKLLHLYYHMFGDTQSISPDVLLIERKSAGIQAIQELREMGIPVSEFSPHGNQHMGGNDKVARVNSVLDMFYSGFVWYRKGPSWAQEVIEECTNFRGASGDVDDYVDTVTQALIRFRKGGFIQLPTDEKVQDETDTLQTVYKFY